MKYLGEAALNALTSEIKKRVSLEKSYTDALYTENKDILSAINEVDEKIRGYVENLQMNDAYLTDTGEELLTTPDGEPLVMSNPIYELDNSISDIYTVLSPTSEGADCTEQIRTALQNTKKIVYLSKGTFGIHDITVFSASDYILRGFSPQHTVIKWVEPTGTNKYQQTKGYKNITFENITFDGLARFNFYNCENITFKNCRLINFTYSGLFCTKCKNIKIIGCEFDEIGTEITLKSGRGDGIQLVECSEGSVLIENCRINETKCYGIAIYQDTPNIAIRNNYITNTVHTAIHFWKPQGATDKYAVVENNVIIGAGFGTPTPGYTEINEYGQVTGVGTAGIYAGGTSYDISFPNSIVRNNLVVKTREVGIEGIWAMVENNTVMYTGVEAGTGEGERYTPSISGIHFRPVLDYPQTVRGNTVVTESANALATVGPCEGSDVTVQGNILICSETGKSISLVKHAGKSLIIKDNYCSSCVYIHNGNTAYDTFVFDNPCPKFEIVYPIRFARGYFDPGGGERSKSIYIDEPYKKNSITGKDDGSITVGKWGYIYQNYPINGKILDGADCCVWVKTKYTAANADNDKAYRLEIYGKNSKEYTYLDSTDNAETTMNVIMKPSTLETQIPVRYSNSSNWFSGYAYGVLNIRYSIVTIFIKEAE